MTTSDVRKEKWGKAALLVILAACLLLQIVSLSTRYEGVYEGACSGGDLEDCGPSEYHIVTLFWSFPAADVRDGELQRYRLIALLAPVVIEVGVLAALITSRKNISSLN